METRFYSRLGLPGGEFTLFFSPLGLTGLNFPGFEREAALAEARTQTPDPQIVSRLTAYFKGEKVGFGEFCLDWTGASAFCRLVWQEAREIPWGKTLTYGEIARKIGRPGAARAVGQAMRINPLPVIVPCHRVLGKNERLTGFALGLAWKEKLLQIEGIKCIR